MSYNLSKHLAQDALSIPEDESTIQDLWRRIMVRKRNNDQLGTLHNMLDWLEQWERPSKSKKLNVIWDIIPFYYAWGIWLERNRWIFKGEKDLFSEIIEPLKEQFGTTYPS